jgi:hypothetical protein
VGKIWGWGTVSEISQGGCFIDINQPLAIGSETWLRLFISGEVLEVGAKVAWTTPQVGMGMRYEAISPELESKITRLLKKVSGQEYLSAPTAEPLEFLVPENADLPLECEGITPEAAAGILAKIIERVQETGRLTEQELMEIVNAGR